MLPTTINKLVVRRCRDLQRIGAAGDLAKLRQLIIAGCPALEELPNLARVSCSEKIEIKSCEKLQNIVVPATLNKLNVRRCRDSRRVAAGDLANLTLLIITDCPALEELPNLARVSCKKIGIKSCEKLQNIVLPTTVKTLDVENCRDLQRVAVAGDLAKLKQLIIADYPALEEFPSLPRVRFFKKKIEIRSCEKLKNLSGLVELHASEHMKLWYCSVTLLRNCIQKLKSLRSKRMAMIGRVVDGAESSLNRNLFSERNISVDAVIEIGSENTFLEWSKVSLIIGCFVVVSDSSTSLQHLDLDLIEGEYFPACSI